MIFKVGDKVRLIKPYFTNRYKMGTIYTVRYNKDSSELYVPISDSMASGDFINTGSARGYFELVLEEAPTQVIKKEEGWGFE